MPALPQSSQNYQQLQAQADRLLDLVVYVNKPGFFLACQTCLVAIPLNVLLSHFSITQAHSYSRKDCT